MVQASRQQQGSRHAYSTTLDRVGRGSSEFWDSKMNFWLAWAFFFIFFPSGFGLFAAFAKGRQIAKCSVQQAEAAILDTTSKFTMK
jgi:hypothetical protein